MAAEDVEVRHLVDGLRAEGPGAGPVKLVGLAIAYDAISRDLGGFVERIAKGAPQFDDGLPALHNHDTSRVLGRTPRTLRLTTDDRGLHFELDPPRSAADLVESVQRGDATGVSFAFSHAKDSWDTSVDPPIRTVHSMRVHEISLATTFPAYSQPHVAVAQRSLASARSAEKSKSLRDDFDFTAMEVPVPETPTLAVADPVPPISPVITTRDVLPDPEVRVLAPADSFRAWVAERTRHPQEFAHVRLGDALRALVTGPHNELERRVLSEGTDSAGGYTVPDILMAQWLDKLRAALVVVQAGATTVPLSSDVTKLARLITDPTAAWRAENAAVAESDPAFDAVTFAPKSLDVFTKVSRELLEDSLNASEMIENSLIRSFAVEVDRVALHGTGTAPQPRGLRNIVGLNELSQGTNGATLTSYDPILDLLALLWSDNVTAVNTAVMAPRTLTTISKFKEATTNAPLARPAVLAGWQFLMTANMPITETQGSASNASTIFIGNWAELYLGFRTQMNVEVARELFRANYQHAFFAHLRMDVQVAHVDSFGRLIGIIP
jgi:HK97 family phage major capsid protein/HK97 family phage prohead protease